MIKPRLYEDGSLRDNLKMVVHNIYGKAILYAKIRGEKNKYEILPKNGKKYVVKDSELEWAS